MKSCAKYYSNAETCPSILLEGSPPLGWWELLCTMILIVIMWCKEIWDQTSCYTKYGKCLIFNFLPPHWRLCYGTTANNSSYAVVIFLLKKAICLSWWIQASHQFLFFCSSLQFLKDENSCEIEAYVYWWDTHRRQTVKFSYPFHLSPVNVWQFSPLLLLSALSLP